MTSQQIQILLVDIALILLVAKAFAAIARRLRQPPVVGEIIAGIALGPTLLHQVVANTLFPSAVVSPLTAMADLGVALFMFGIGLEMDLRRLRIRLPQSLAVGLGSMLVPFAGGLVLALSVLRDSGTAHHGAFLVFIALSVSVTAFPVLARILADRGLTRTEAGVVAIAAAAVVDLAGWSALAAVQANVDAGGGSWRVLLLPPFAALLFCLRPAIRRLAVPGSVEQQLGRGRTAVVLSGVALSGAATEAMGLHFIFGAFLFGLAMPRGDGEAAQAFRADLLASCGELTAVLLPLYFLVAGLQVNLGEFRERQLADLAAVLAVAISGKLIGGYLGGRCLGLRHRPAASVAVLMNTRGLTELIFLGVGKQDGLLDQTQYSILVAMAVVTTVLTGPLLNRLGRRSAAADPQPEPVAGTPALSSS